jgi:predicted regulator of Ras-like GTPase activity (Roadblock/LC7/MglB family)
MPTPFQNDRIPAPRLDPSLATLKPKAPQTNKTAPIPQSAAPVVSNETKESAQNDLFTIALMDVAAFWSEKGRNDLANLYRHSLDIPMRTLESALKSGKLTFQWQEVRPWLRLAPGNTMPTLQDDLLIELPLAVIAPRFVEQRAQGKPRRRIEVGDDIPDVFEQKTPSPGQVPSTTTTPPLGATAVPMEIAPSLGASSATGDTAFLTRAGGKTLLEFGEIFGQPEKKNWSLAEVAQKTMSLRGVAGAIIASNEGLLVAGSWPNGVKGDAVSAFLPQLYGRILQYTKELKLGEPGHVTLMIENVPLQIFKAGTSFFTVIGRAGENLPKAQLNAIATRLSTNFSVK